MYTFYSGFNNGPPKKYIYLEPVNVTSFGKRVFANVSKSKILRLDNPDQSEPKFNDTCLYKRQKRGTQADMQRGRPCEEERETKFRCIPAKDSKHYHRNQETGMKWILPQILQKETMLLSSRFQISSLLNYNRINFYCLKPSSLW